MLPDSITTLIAALSKLPGVGPRSAERIALHLVQTESGVVKHLADSILNARQRIQFCTTCGALTEQSPCPTCEDPRRDGSLICVVERAVDILSIEKAGTFRGNGHEWVDARPHPGPLPQGEGDSVSAFWPLRCGWNWHANLR